MSWGARAYLRELIVCGVEVWEMGPSFNHSKLTVIDGEWLMMGSANLDPRSFRLNFEFNVEAYSRELAARVADYMDRQVAGARRINMNVLDKESAFIRVRNRFIALFSPFL